MAKKLQWTVLLIFIGVLFYWPAAKVLAFGGFNWSLDASAGSAIWFTIWQALTSTLISLVLALPVAHLLYRRAFASRVLLRALVTVPFVLPVIVVAIGFAAVRRFVGFDAEGSSSIGWIIAAHVFFNLAVAVRTIGAVWAGLDNSVLEAAVLDGASRLKAFWSVQLPQLRSAIAAAGLLIFLYCLTSFGTILILGGGVVHSIETEIFFSVEQFLDLGRTASLALVQLVLGVSVYLLANRFGVVETPLEAELVSAGRQVTRTDWFSVIFTVLVLIGLLAPMLAVVFNAFAGSSGLANFANLAGQGAREVLNISVLTATSNSLRNVLVTLVLGLGVGVLVARLLWARPSRWLEVVFLAPLSVSSVVLGLGYLVGFAEPPLAVRDSWLAVPLAQTMVVLPLVVQLVHAGFKASNPELTQAAAVDGANGWQTWWQVQLPVIRQSIATAVVFATVAGIGEFGTASLLVYGDQETLPTVLYRLMARPGTENFGMAMAASSLLISFTLLAVLLAGLTRESEPKRQPR